MDIRCRYFIFVQNFEEVADECGLCYHQLAQIQLETQPHLQPLDDVLSKAKCYTAVKEETWLISIIKLVPVEA